jgi:hypothetical protein
MYAEVEITGCFAAKLAWKIAVGCRLDERIKGEQDRPVSISFLSNRLYTTVKWMKSRKTLARCSSILHKSRG